MYKESRTSPIAVVDWQRRATVKEHLGVEVASCTTGDVRPDGDARTQNWDPGPARM